MSNPGNDNLGSGNPAFGIEDQPNAAGTAFQKFQDIDGYVSDLMGINKAIMCIYVEFSHNQSRNSPLCSGLEPY